MRDPGPTTDGVMVDGRASGHDPPGTMRQEPPSMKIPTSTPRTVDGPTPDRSMFILEILVAIVAGVVAALLTTVS
jgi:hypothetical protein